MSKKKTQKDWILEQLLVGRKLTAFLAYREYGIMRLGARIFDLQQEGYVINSQSLAVVNRHGEICHVAEYSLSQE